MSMRQINVEEIGAGPAVVDTPSAQEFLAEIHRRATPEQLAGIVSDLERKAHHFAIWQRRDALLDPDGVAVRGLLRHVFATRRRVSAVLGLAPAPELGRHVDDLVRGPGALADRFDGFCSAVDLPAEIAAELAAELLHFGDPGKYWLWSRWVWNPLTRTGALPLVADEDFDLEVDGLGATYVRVGEAIRFLDESAEAASFRPASGGNLGTDVFLAGIYGVYMSTVLGLKMSQEFNAVVPALPELARRLLGVHRMEVS